jgi:hypothetical protein
MEAILNKISSRVEEEFYGAYVSMNISTLKNNEAKHLKNNLKSFYAKFLDYIRQRYDFSDSNYHKHLRCLSLEKEFSFGSVVKSVEAVNLELNMDQLFDEHIKLQEFIKSGAGEKLNIPDQYVKKNSTPNVSAPNLKKLASLVLSIPCTKAHSERIFSLMQQDWTDPRNRFFVENVKAELQIFTNYQNYNCVDIYDEFDENKELLATARLSKKYDNVKVRINIYQIK